MRSNYDESYKFTAQFEGGWVNHKDDPGGPTMRGVTQRVYDAYRRRKGQEPFTVRKISTPEVEEIYRKEYWNRAHCDELPIGVDFAVYDFAVNSGVSRAVKYLQGIVGAKRDGVIGIMTLDAIKEHDPEELVIRLCEERWAFMKRLRHWKTFKNGWTRRVMGNRVGAQTDDTGVIDIGLKMVRNESKADVVIRPVEGKAESKTESEPDSVWDAFLALVAAILAAFNERTR